MTNENPTVILSNATSCNWRMKEFPLTSTALTVAPRGWMIVGKPTLRQLLRYWWNNRH